MNIFSYLINLDYNVAIIIISWRSDFFDSLFLFITRLGSWYIITFLFIITAVLFILYSKSKLIKPFFICLLGSGLMSLIIKFLVDRSRPSLDLALYSEKLPSFPSAHATLILVFFGFLTYCIWRFRISRVIKIIMMIVFIVIIIFVGFSRIYLGVHFLSDIIGGYLVGLLWLLIAMYISRKSFSLLYNNRP